LTELYYSEGGTKFDRFDVINRTRVTVSYFTRIMDLGDLGGGVKKILLYDTTFSQCDVVIVLHYFQRCFFKKKS
jgi:hypothetical protein